MRGALAAAWLLSATLDSATAQELSGAAATVRTPAAVPAAVIATRAVSLTEAPRAPSAADATRVPGLPAGAGSSDPRALELRPISSGALSAEAALRPRLIVLTWHDIRDDGSAPAASTDATTISVRTLIEQFEMLRTLDATPISLQQWLDAEHGLAGLPPRPVLLTFDDGYRSLYQRVFPLLKLYGYPALAAVVGQWTEGKMDAAFPVEPCTPEQLREMADSGLLEFASHTYGMHTGITGNPQHNQQPAAVTRRFDSDGDESKRDGRAEARIPDGGNRADRSDDHSRRYESEADYQARLASDMSNSSRVVEQATGRKPRVIVWPYGAYNLAAQRAAQAAGFSIGMDLDNAANFAIDGSRATVSSERVANAANASASASASVAASTPAPLPTLHRTLVESNMQQTDFAHLLLDVPSPRSASLGTLRSIRVSLDDVYDPDPQRQEARLSAQLERIRMLGVNTVLLEGYADDDHDGVADAVYFPNRQMPMRADLFNRAAWQMRTRLDVKVFATMPRRAFHLDGLQSSLSDGEDRIVDLFSDLAHQGQFAGLALIDPEYGAVVESSSRIGPAASRSNATADAAAGAGAGAGANANAGAGADADIDADEPLSARLRAAVAAGQPTLMTMTALRTSGNGAGDEALRTALEHSLERYDFIALEIGVAAQAGADRPGTTRSGTTPADILLLERARHLVALTRQIPDAFDRALFELPTQADRSTGQLDAALDLPRHAPASLARRLTWLLRAGARHVGYQRDQFQSDSPQLADVRALVSTATVANPRH